MDPKTTITRSELYDLIWSKPIVQLAKSYGLSDVGLSKLCQRYNIPRPPRGHWVKLQHGKPVHQTPLPAYEGHEKIPLKEAEPEKPPSAIREKATSNLEAERQPENRITVQDEADGASLHQLVQKASDQLANARTDASGRITPRKNPTLAAR